MIGAAAQEREGVGVPVRHPEAQHLGVELHHLLHVGDAVRDVAELERRDRRLLAVVLGEHVVGIKLDHRALDVGEDQRPRRARRNAVPLLALDAVLRQLPARRRAKSASGATWNDSRVSVGLVALLERDRLEPGAGRQERAVLVALGDDQAEHVGVIRHLPLEIGRGEGRVSDAQNVDHVGPPIISGAPAPGSSARRAAAATCSAIQSPGFTGPTPSGVPV